MYKEKNTFVQRFGHMRESEQQLSLQQKELRIFTSLSITQGQ
jgi:hypothetical protein